MINKFLHDRVWLFVLLWVGMVGCSQNEAGNSTAAATKTVPQTATITLDSPISTPSVMPSPTYADVICTLLGCRSVLHVQLTGHIPPTLVVEATEPEGNTVLGGCFPLPEDALGALALKHEAYGPDDEEAIKEAQIMLGNLPVCAETNVAYLGVYRRLDESPYSIFAVCSNTTVEPGQIDFDCGQDNRVEFIGFTPRQVAITVYTSDSMVEVEVSPQYTTVYPNGQQCPPACQSATVTVDLP